jgi:hypothetical protein
MARPVAVGLRRLSHTIDPVAAAMNSTAGVTADALNPAA